MTRTFNRQPFSVNTPSKKNVKDYFFNHYNWKGLNDDKNFLTVDQESFSDCNNVYMDREGLLRSRPSLMYERANGIWNIWEFGNIEVTMDSQKIKFTNRSTKENVWEIVNVWRDMVPILCDEKIFVFSSKGIAYYDILTNTYTITDDYTYIPITKLYVNNVLSDENFESANVLTTKSRIRYTFDGVNYDFNTFINKTVNLQIGDSKYKNYEFKEESPLTFVDQLTVLTDQNYDENTGEPFIDISEKGTIVKTTITSTGYLIQYSVDGIIYKSLPQLVGVISKARISKDGLYVFAITKDTVYVHSVAATDDGTYKYNTWVDLFKQQSNYSEWYNNLPIVCKINGLIEYLCSAEFISDNIFIINAAFGEIKYNNNSPSKLQLNLLYQCLDGKLSVKAISDPMDYLSPIVIEIPTSVSSSNNVSKTYSNNDVNKTFNCYRDFAAYDNNKQNNIANVTIDSVSYTEFTTIRSSSLSMSGTIIYKYNPNSTENLSNTKTYEIPLYFDSQNRQGSINPSSEYYIENIRFIVGDDDATGQIVANAYWSSSNNKIYITLMGASFYASPVGDSSMSFYKGDPTLIYTKISDSDLIKPFYSSLRANNYKGRISMETYRDANNNITSNIIILSKLYSSAWHVNFDSLQSYRNNVYELLYTNNANSTQSRSRELDDVHFLQGEAYWATYNIVEATSTSEKQEQLVVHTFSWELDDYDKEYLVHISNVINSTSNISDTFRLSINSNYLLTKNELYTYSKYDLQKDDETNMYVSVKLLHQNVTPIKYYYAGNQVDSMYYIKDNILYSNSAVKTIIIDETIDGTANYIAPEHWTELDEYYWSIGKSLYISLERRDDNDNYLWYFPKREAPYNTNQQDFDYNITNLHPISTSEVAIFFNDSIHYVSYDTDNKLYRYFKTKAQVGCLEGSDVITTFDSKYTLFTSSRGIVAMSYQEFISSTEQALSYITDSINSVFDKYLNKNYVEPGLVPVYRKYCKLYKYNYWIFVYKSGDVNSFIYDTRNGSWWPITLPNAPEKVLSIDDKPIVLLRGMLHTLNTLDTNYFDLLRNKSSSREERYNISWFIKSQKLYLSAVNYYKHIASITFNSVHDLAVLQDSDYNINELDFVLQVNNYRKKVDGNIDTSDGEVLNYKVENIRTFVQRLNYSKVNEFEYKLSSDNEALNVPLSLSGISIKYKIGDKIR